MLKIPVGQTIAEQIIKKNQTNYEYHYPHKVDKYHPPELDDSISDSKDDEVELHEKSEKKKAKARKKQSKLKERPNEPAAAAGGERDDENYIDVTKISPHILMKAVDRQMNMNND
mmetsp:Transcript_18763/g.28842  ORF Transcript_18763/g.28842 Transcript_18763/m.28842 type:complete len:115 (-) Transcript_18763:950-1294(-)